MVYFHLYVLAPRLLHRRKYFIYILATISLLFVYSYVNFSMLKLIPHSLLPVSLEGYIKLLNPRYDVFEGFFTLIITYSLKYAWQAVATKNKLLELQKNNLMLELNALKAQINPHFLFNTLNNIYSLSIKKSDQAPEMILKLSDMMRYVLYDCNSGPVPVEKEIQFINNYIELEKIRHGEHIDIRFSLSGKLDNSKIEPLLLIPFIENSFKHGVNAKMENGWVDVNLNIFRKKITMNVINSLPDASFNNNGKSGIGLINVKKRLDLIYPHQYQLQIQPMNDHFEVNLEINLN